jgi:hypothetical protein
MNIDKNMPQHELETLIKNAQNELSRRQFSEEKRAVYEVNSFGCICVYKCPRAAIKSLDEMLVGTADEPLEKTWEAPSHEGEGTYISIKTKMIGVTEYDQQKDWWLGAF